MLTSVEVFDLLYYSSTDCTAYYPIKILFENRTPHTAARQPVTRCTGAKPTRTHILLIHIHTSWPMLHIAHTRDTMTARASVHALQTHLRPSTWTACHTWKVVAHRRLHMMVQREEPSLRAASVISSSLTPMEASSLLSCSICASCAWRCCSSSSTCCATFAVCCSRIW